MGYGISSSLGQLRQKFYMGDRKKVEVGVEGLDMVIVKSVPKDVGGGVTKETKVRTERRWEGGVSSVGTKILF